MTVELAARVTRGLEWVAADEVAALAGATDLRLAPRQVTAHVEELTAAALGLRAVDDAFVRVGNVHGVGRSPGSVAATARAVAALDVAGAARLVAAARSAAGASSVAGSPSAAGAPGAGVRPVPEQPVVDVVASLDGDRRYSRFDVEDTAGPLLARALGGTHHSRRHGRPPPPDLTVRVVVTGSVAEVLVRVADRPLHRRPWKVATGPGTLHPPVAAALLRLAGAAEVVVDPCCGDGTIPVEAVTGACGGPGGRALGTDLDRARATNALGNAQAAGAGDQVLVAVADAARLPLPHLRNTAIVTNPPWDLAVAAAGGLHGGLTPLWREAARVAGEDGRLVTVADAGLDAPGSLTGAGWEVVLAERVRLAGRLGDVVVAHLPGATDPVAPSLRRWRARAEGL